MVEDITKTLRDKNFQKEFYGMLMLIVVYPLIAVFITTFQKWVDSQIWSWALILSIMAYEIAPGILAWFKKRTDAEKADKDAEIKRLNETLRQVQIDHTDEVQEANIRHLNELNGKELAIQLLKQRIEIYEQYGYKPKTIITSFPPETNSSNVSQNTLPPTSGSVAPKEWSNENTNIPTNTPSPSSTSSKSIFKN